MKNIILVFLAFSSLHLFAQDTNKVVSELKLKEVDQQVTENAKLTFMEVFTEKLTNQLFSGILFVGPGLVNQMKVKKYKHLANATFLIPVLNSNNEMIDKKQAIGKMIQDKKDFDLLWKQVVKELGTSVTLRELNRNEMYRMWELFSDKFSQPLFVAESAQTGFVVMMTSKFQLLFIDKSLP